MSARLQPASSSSALILSMTTRVCVSTLPQTIAPVASVGTWPETKTKSPARTAGVSGIALLAAPCPSPP